MIGVMSMIPPAKPPRRQPRPTPSFVEPTPKSGFDIFAENYAKGNQRRVDDIVKYGGETSGLGSRTADLLVSQGVSDSPGLRAGALAGDILLDPGWLVPGVGAAKGAQVAGRAVNTYRAMPPENQALYNAMLRGLYHGNRNTGANVAQPFTAVNRGAEDWSRNWFGGDLFGTASRKLGDQYAGSATNKLVDDSGNLVPGLTREGYPITQGARFRLSEPLSSVGQRNILDLTGRTLDEADPALYQRLVDEFADPDDPLDFAKELAKMDLTGSAGMGRGLHQSSFSQSVRPILEESGYDTIRHLSGQTAQGDIVSPVYAFLRPQGIRATPTLPSPSRAMDMTDAAVGQGLGKIFSPVDQAISRTGAAVREGGESFADSLASVLRREDPSVLPAPIRDFVKRRTGPVFRGENFPDVRNFNSNPALIALLKRLGLDRLFPDAPAPSGGMTAPAFGDL